MIILTLNRISVRGGYGIYTYTLSSPHSKMWLTLGEGRPPLDPITPPINGASHESQKSQLPNNQNHRFRKNTVFMSVLHLLIVLILKTWNSNIHLQMIEYDITCVANTS